MQKQFLAFDDEAGRTIHVNRDQVLYAIEKDDSFKLYFSNGQELDVPAGFSQAVLEVLNSEDLSVTVAQESLRSMSDEELKDLVSKQHEEIKDLMSKQQQ